MNSNFLTPEKQPIPDDSFIPLDALFALEDESSKENKPSKNEPPEKNEPLKNANPENAYKKIRGAEENYKDLHEAKPESVLKRKKRESLLQSMSIHHVIYSVCALQQLNVTEDEDTQVLRYVVNTLYEMLIAESGQAGRDRVAHYKMAKLTLDNKGKIPENYDECKGVQALSAGMLKVRKYEGKNQYCGMSHHSGGFKLRFTNMLIALATLLQQPDENLADPFELIEVDNKGKEVARYLCPLTELREQVFSKFSKDELKKMADANSRKVVIQLIKASPVSQSPTSKSDEDKPGNDEDIFGPRKLSSTNPYNQRFFSYESPKKTPPPSSSSAATSPNPVAFFPDQDLFSSPAKTPPTLKSQKRTNSQKAEGRPVPKKLKL